MIDLLCWRDKSQRRETRIVHMLWFIQKTVWKVGLDSLSFLYLPTPSLDSVW